MNPKRVAVIASIALIASSQAVEAQMKSSSDLGSIPGSVKPWPVNSESWGYNAADDVTLAQKAAVKANVEAVYNVFARTPVIAQPKGFTVWRFRGMVPSDRIMYDDRQWAIPAQFGFNFIWHWMREDDHIIHSNGEGEGGGFEVAINSLRCIFEDDGRPFMEDAQGGMYFAPVVVGKRFGFPQYHAGCIVMTRRNAPLFLPVPRERVLRKLIADQKESGKAIEEMLGAYRKLGRTDDVRMLEANDAPRRNRVRYLEQMLAAMTPAERAKPAYLNLRYPSVDSVNVFGSPEANDPMVQLLVTANPDFYDRTLPRTAIQTITSTFGCWQQKNYSNPNALQATCDVENEPFFRSYAQLFKSIRDQLDWAALTALLQ